MAEFNETPTEEPKVKAADMDDVPNPGRRNFLGLAGKAAALVAARKLLPPTFITGMLGQVESADKSIERANKPVYELPPFPEFVSPDPEQRIIVIPLREKGEAELMPIAELEHGLELVRYQYEADSYGKLGYSYKVLPWQEVNLPKDRDYNKKVASAGNSALQRLGEADLDQYDARLYVLASDNKPVYNGKAFSSNPSAGKTYIRPDRAVVFIDKHDTFNSFGSTAKHELGHTLGLGHANSVRLEGVGNYSGKTVFEGYTGIDDPMGANDGRRGMQLSAPHRVSLGWIGKDQVQSVEQDGIFTLNDVSKGSGVLALRFQKPDTDHRYYVSYRGKGEDGLPKLEVHIWKEKGWSPAEVKTEFASWSDGDEIYDSINGIRIKQLSHVTTDYSTRGEGTVAVQITFDKK